jgi:hypothetical protein
MKKSLCILLFTISLTQTSLADTADTSLPCQPFPSHTPGHEDFCYHGHPINPACVDRMVGDLRGGTDVVNLSKCESENRHNNFTATLDGRVKPGWYSVITCNAANPKTTCMNDAFGAYKVIGRTANDTFVVNTYSSGGGSGVFNQLGEFHIYYNSKGEKYLAWVGSLAGGDRALGSVIAGTVTMKGTHVMGLRESDINTTATPEYAPQKFNVDLSKIPAY